MISELHHNADTYSVSVGSPDRNDTKWLWLHGAEDTEFQARHLVPADVARSIV